MKNRIEWEKISEGDMQVIDHIVKRALALYASVGIGDHALSATMDVAGAHLDQPIDLEALRDADDETFAHDMLGIRRHFNRRTFKLEDCFSPRTAIPV